MKSLEIRANRGIQRGVEERMISRLAKKNKRKEGRKRKEYSVTAESFTNDSLFPLIGDLFQGENTRSPASFVIVLGQIH